MKKVFLILAASSRVSIDYMIDRDGTIVQMVREANIAGHCANLDTIHNRLSIGIEYVCSIRSELTDAQYSRSAALVRWLCDRHAIPAQHNPTPLAPGVRGHSEEYTSSTRGCPNRHWDWERYLSLLNGN